MDKHGSTYLAVHVILHNVHDERSRQNVARSVRKRRIHVAGKVGIGHVPLAAGISIRTGASVVRKIERKRERENGIMRVVMQVLFRLAM